MMNCFTVNNKHESSSLSRKKVVPVADKSVGIGSLLERIKVNDFTDTRPTSRDDITAHVEIGKQMVALGFLYNGESSGSEYDHLRPLLYDQTNVFLLCFAIDNRSSLEHVQTKWAKEIEPHRKNASVIVVGTKKDLRKDATIDKTNLVTSEEGEALAVSVQAFGYVECSAKSSDGVSTLLHVIGGAALSHDQSQVVNKTFCVVL